MPHTTSGSETTAVAACTALGLKEQSTRRTDSVMAASCGEYDAAASPAVPRQNVAQPRRVLRHRRQVHLLLVARPPAVVAVPLQPVHPALDAHPPRRRAV